MLVNLFGGEEMERLTFFLIALIVLPIISADIVNTESSLGPFAINTDVELIQICSNATSICDSCNITSVKYQNSTIIVSDVAMTNRTNDFNYSIGSTDINTIGIYSVDGFCNSGNQVGVWTYTFEVTNTGDKLSTSSGIIYLVFLLGILFVWGLCLWGAIKIPFRNQRNQEGKVISVNDLKFVKIFLIVVSYLLLMWTMGILRSITANYLLLAGAGKIFNYLFWIMFSFFWPLLIVSLAIGVVTWLGDKKLIKSLGRGIFPRR